jgi:hypothetical protein
VARCFKPDGTGALVTASRSVIYAYEEGPRSADDADWQQRVAEACKEFVTTIRALRTR